MISKAIIEAVIKQAKPVDKDRMLEAFISKLNGEYSYNDDKVSRCLEILLGASQLVNPYDVDMDYIKKNINKYIYKPENYIIKDIELESIYNIDGVVCIGYKSKEKINEDRNDIEFEHRIVNISFIDYPQVLKKS